MMRLFELLAMGGPSAGGATEQDPRAGILNMVFMVVMVVVMFYFLLLRPQQKQRKEQENSLFNLKKGDEIVTVGGLVGEILRIKEQQKEGIPVKSLEDRITLKTGESTVVIHRGRVHQVLKSSGSDVSAA